MQAEKPSKAPIPPAATHRQVTAPFDCALSFGAGDNSVAPRMKILSLLTTALLFQALQASEVPEVLQYLPKEKFVKAATTMVLPPKEIGRYLEIVDKAAAKDPEWFREQAKNAEPNTPPPYDERLGLTKEQYDEYIELWKKREFKTMELLVLYLSETGENVWTIRTPGTIYPIATLKYDANEDVFKSPNGELERIEDVETNELNALGHWIGHEWRLEKESALGKTKENMAIGKTGDGKFGLIIYRLQELSSLGTRTYDKSLVIRFALGEAGIIEEPELPQER